MAAIEGLAKRIAESLRSYRTTYGDTANTTILEEEDDDAVSRVSTELVGEPGTASGALGVEMEVAEAGGALLLPLSRRATCPPARLRPQTRLASSPVSRRSTLNRLPTSTRHRP